MKAYIILLILALTSLFGYFGIKFKAEIDFNSNLHLTKFLKAPNDQNFNVQSFNVRVKNDFCRYDKDCYVEARAPNVLLLILKYRPLTIGFQEVSTFKILGDEWYTILKNGLSSKYDSICMGRDGDMFSEATPIFYDRDRLELIESGTKWLSPTPDVPGSKFPDTPDHPTDGYPRIMTYVIVKIKETGYTYMHINTHLDYKSFINRRSQIQVVESFAKNYTDKMPVIITGDFNSENREIDKENNDAVPYLLANGFASAGIEAPVKSDHWTYEAANYAYDNWENCTERGHHANGKTIKEQPICDKDCDKENGKIIDYCLKLDNGKTNFTSYKVLDDLDEENKIASDHYSIFIEGVFH